MKNRFPPSLQLYFCLLLLGTAGFFLTLFLYPPAGFYGFAVMVALGGFGVAANIFQTKRAGGELVCPSGSNCNVVVNSRFSKFFGVHLEVLGMMYFGLIAISYGTMLLFPKLIEGGLLMAVALATMAAALFSLYLLFVQAFLLGEWCIWCILSSMFSLVIFAISFITFDQVGVPVREFISSIDGLLEFLTFLGYAIGVGGSTSAVVLFFGFLKDLNITEKELTSIKGLVELVWFGFGLTIVSLLVSFSGAPEVMMYSAPLITQITVLLVISFSSAALMIMYTPFLVFMPFSSLDDKRSSSWLYAIRKPTFIIGSVVLSSWYYALAVNFLPDHFSLTNLLIGYMIVLCAAIILTWIVEGGFFRKSALKTANTPDNKSAE